MGLRLWRDPDDDATADEAAAKLDRAAAARRSTIRREPSIRPGRDHVSPQNTWVSLRQRQQNMLRTRDRLRQEERETDSQIAQLQAELERLRRNRLRNRLRLHEELEATRAGRDSLDQSSPTTEQPSPDENVESSTVVPLDVASRPTLHSSLGESNLRFESRINLPPLSRSSSPWRYQVLSRATMPSPPRSADSTDQRDRTVPDGPIPGDVWSANTPHMPALTEGFAPVRRDPQDTSHQQSSHREDEFQGLETPPPESWESSYAQLHRVGHRSPRPQPRVDGLGDRRRSPSPTSDHNEEDTWMSNLLTTMGTSRSSSATSLELSRTDTVGRSHNSSQTTSTSFGEIGSLDDLCELDLPEGITADDVREIREQHSHSRRQPLADQRLYHRLWSLRAHMDRGGSADLGIYDAIRERLVRQEPVPQDWWVAIGLPPDYGTTH